MINKSSPAARRAAACIACTVLLSGCSWLPWLGGEKDPTPPTELVKFEPETSASVAWIQDIGKGTGERRLQLVPALHNGRLYAGDTTGRVTAVNAADGRVLWEKETGLRLSGGPGVAGGHLVLGSTDGDLIALSSADGRELWRIRTVTEILSVPTIGGDIVVVHTIDDSVLGYDLATGEERWRFSEPAPILTLRGSSTPVIRGDGAIVGISGGQLVNLALTDGTPLWEISVTRPRGRSELERIADIDATPAIVGNVAFVGTYNGDLAAVDIDNATVIWRRELSAHAGLSADTESLYITDSDDNIWAADPVTGAGRWKQERLRYRDLTAPVIYGDLLAVGDFEGYIHWLARSDGRIVARTRASKGAITATPVVSGGKLYVYVDNGKLAALTAARSVPRRSSSAKTGAVSASAPDRDGDGEPADQGI